MKPEIFTTEELALIIHAAARRGPVSMETIKKVCDWAIKLRVSEAILLDIFAGKIDLEWDESLGDVRMHLSELGHEQADKMIAEDLIERFRRGEE